MSRRTLISATELAAILDRPGIVVVDVRHDLADADAGARAYAAGHLPGAVFLHQDRDLAGPKTGRNGRHPLPAPEALAARLSAIGVDHDTQVIAYDQNSGMFASRLWWLMRWLGHPAVAVLDGGLDAWCAEGRPLATDVPRAPAAGFAAKAPAPAASASEILAALGSASLLVIDARAGERYRGEIEPLDPVAGHIPGARNRPVAENLVGGRFKDPATLRREFESLLGARPPSAVVHQCGSGITACHNLLAMEVAGLPGSRLYPGSWSEWCSDPQRPVERGAPR